MTNKKLVVVLNNKIDSTQLMNAVAHMAFGLAGSIADQTQLELVDYKDADDSIHPSISEIGFIVLSAKNSNQIRKLRSEAIRLNIKHTDFIDTMLVGTAKNKYREQVELTAKTKEEELEYLGICLFGDFEKTHNLTKKFSLWKSKLKSSKEVK